MAPFKQIDDQTRVSLPLEKEVKILLAVAGLIAAAYTARDKVLADVRATIAAAVQQERESRQEAQTHLATKEDVQRAVSELRILIIERTKR